MIKIGVDPAFRKSGFAIAIFQTETKTLRHIVFENFKHFAKWLMYESPEQAKVIIENSYLQNTNFDKTGDREVLARKNRNVGMNQAVSQIVSEFFKARYGNQFVFDVSPKKKGGKWSKQTYLNILRQMKINCLTKANNQDIRDATKLALMKIH